MSRSRKGLVLSLCLKDLRHEWMLTVCMIMAVSAVLGPLLILFGLKFGTVETLRGRLVNDPRNREIRPISSHSFPLSWFSGLQDRDDVAFVIPATRQLATAVELSVPGGKSRGLSVDAVPTAPGDPLVLGNGARVPEPGQALLSFAAAEELQKGPGDELLLTVRRMKGGGFETGTTNIRITGVLPMSAGAIRSVFLPLAMVEAVEHFKDGQAVPVYGWPGELPRAYPAFSSLLVHAPTRLGPEAEFKLINNTGFSSKKEVSAATARMLTGSTDNAIGESGVNYQLSTVSSPVSAQNIFAVRNALAGQNTLLYPFDEKAEISLAGEGGNSLGTFAMLPAAPFASVKGTDLPEKAPWKDDLSQNQEAASEWLIALAPKSLAGVTKASAKITRGEYVLEFPLQLKFHPGVAEGTLKVPLRLLGVSGLMQTRPLSFDQTSHEFLVNKRGFAGFRLYANTLEQVAPLKKDLEEQGILVHTEAERIDDVLRLDKYLSLIFWLIAAGSLVGGTACLVSNIYAGIERKRRELAVLRLLGLSGGGFVRFPLYTAGFFALSGFVVAFCLYACMSFIINSLFGAHLQAGESLCFLAWWHPIIALALTLGVALLAGSVAALRAARVDPADALRND